MHGQLIKLSLLITGAFISLAAPARAADPYVEAGVSLIESDELRDTTQVTGLFRAGLEVTPWLAIEGEGIFGLGDNEDTSPGGIRESEGLDYQFGGYGRLGVPIREHYLLYFRAGVATAKVSRSFTFPQGPDSEPFVTDSDESFTGPSGGVGVQGFFGEARKHGVRLDGTFLFSINDDDEGELDGDATGNISLTYVRRF